MLTTSLFTANESLWWATFLIIMYKSSLSQTLLSRILNGCLKLRWSWLHVYWTLWCHDHCSGTWGSHWLNVGGAYITDMLFERMTCRDGQVVIGFHPASHSMNYDWKCIYLITLYSSEGSSTLLYSLFLWIFLYVLCVFQFLYGYCKGCIIHLICYKLETIYI